jgi:hypothetical protein
VTNASFSQNRYWNESGFSDGVTTGLVTLGEYCLSTDPFLTSYPRQWSLGKITNGMRIDMSPTYLVRRDGTQPGIPLEGRVSLYTIQDVNVLYGHCADAVVLWNLDARYSYVPLNFFGKDADLGLTLPTQSDTAGHAVISFRIRALHTDIVAMGGVDPQTGQLLYLGELKQIKTP